MSNYNPRTVTPGTKKNTKYLETKMAAASAERKDEIKKWDRDHPGTPAGTSFKKNTWKAWSQQLIPTPLFRDSFDDICWCGETVSPRCRRHHG